MRLQIRQKYLLAFAVLFSLTIGVVSAQQKPVPLNDFFTREVERASLKDSTSAFVHFGCKPFLESKLNLPKITGYAKDDSLKTYYGLTNVLYKSHLYTVKGDGFFLTIDPVFDLTYSRDFSYNGSNSKLKNPYGNTRGFQAMGDLGKKFSFQTGFYETQNFFPQYLKSFVDSTGVAPGFGRTKAYKALGYDYAMAYGCISYSPHERVNIQFGHGKNFIGHGYRSLLLSDAAFNYPYIKATASFFNNKLQYTAIYASLQTLQRLPLGEVPEALFKRKGGSFNYLSWMPHERIELGLFEGIIWQRYDNKEGTLPQPYGAFIPVIGVNTAINGLDAKQNILTGANLRIKTTKSSYLYGQLAVDNLQHNSWGYQAGIKYYDLLLKRLDIQVEWNSLGDYMYASQYALQNYVHINQPLGHPTGGATDELLLIGNYRWRRILGQVKYNQIYHSTGRQGNWKINPDVVIANNDALPEHYIQQIEISAGLLVNPKWNFQVLVGYNNRLDQIKNEHTGNAENRTSLLYFTLRTNLINNYHDF